MDSKFTPGEWTIGTGALPREPENHAIIAGDSIIARVESSLLSFFPKRSAANVRLMCAAPTMLEALKQTLKECSDLLPVPAIREIRAAIKLAEGE